MKKNLIMTVLAAGGACVMMLSAYGAETTVDDVIKNYFEATKETKSAVADMTMDADVSISMEGMEEDLAAAGHMDASLLFGLEPLQYQMNANMAGSAMGQGGGLDMTMYMVEEDGAIANYIGIQMGEDIQWIKQVTSAEDSAKILEMVANSAQIDMSDMPVTWTLADETTDVNGTECYVVNTTITSENIVPLYEYAMEKVGSMLPEEVTGVVPSSEDLESIVSIFSGIQINMEMDLSKETYKPMRMYIDTEGTDWTIVGAVVAQMMGATDENGDLLPLNVNVNSLFMEAVYNYDTEVAVTVPDDVKEAAQEIDPADLAADLEDVAEIVEGETE